VTTLTITSKGQITFKQSLLKHLGVRPGSKIEVDKLPGGRVIVRIAEQTGTILDFIGCLSHKTDHKPLTIDEINKITAQGWAKHK
jgi:bifunctional DNA-binding transcriptional regulator/antitoxin component of YhaV-PrlF toxin-antitoxin module